MGKPSLDMMNTIRVNLTHVCRPVIDCQSNAVYPCPVWVLRGIGVLEPGGIKPRTIWLASIGPTAFLTEEEMEQMTELAAHNAIDLFVDDEEGWHLEDSPVVGERRLTVNEWLDKEEKRWEEVRQRRYP